MQRFKCLLLDANIVIELFSLGLWDAFVKQCEVHLSEIVVGEADYYEDPEGTRHNIDLTSYRKSGQIQIFSHSADDLAEFKASFDPTYLEKLDPGETESLLHILSLQSEDLYLCSADAIVFRVLGNLKISEQGVSLEEVFHQFGFRRKLEYQFTREFRRRWSQEGLAESLHGKGCKE
jgi:hypothetical protein